MRTYAEWSMDDGTRHICGISGGKDSSALAVYLRDKVPDMEYFFCCYFCFYQRKAEWVGLAERHPELYERAIAIEQKVLLDAGVDGDADFSERAMAGRQYTWSGGETLVQLRSRRQEILDKHETAMHRIRQARSAIPVLEALSEVLDTDDDALACTVCAL